MNFLSWIRLGGIAVLILGATGVVHGRMIYWGTGGQVDFRTSRGEAWSERQRVSLGVFRVGFTPGMENRAQWADNWVELAVADFDEEEERFAGAVDGAVPLPAGFGGQVYLWVADGWELSAGPDWLLATHADWQWPGANASPGLPAMVWTTGESGVVVTGAILDGGMRMASMDVWPDPELPGMWFSRALGREPGPTDWQQDEDADGLSNLAEYALGTDPKDPASRAAPKFSLESTPDGRWWNLEIDRSPESSAVLKLETSADLRRWSGPDGSLEILVDRADKWKARGKLPETGGAGYFRFRYEIGEGAP